MTYILEFGIPTVNDIATLIVANGMTVISVSRYNEGYALVPVQFQRGADKRKVRIGWLPANTDYPSDVSVLGGPLSWPDGSSRYLCIEPITYNPADPDTPPGVPWDPAKDLPSWVIVQTPPIPPDPTIHRKWWKTR
jgi:hypothetical protein